MQYLSIVIPEQDFSLNDIINSFAHEGLYAQVVLVCKTPESVLKYATITIDWPHFEVTPAYYHEQHGAAALFFGRLAKYRRILFCALNVPIHPVDLWNALACFDENKAIGYAGFCINKTQSLLGEHWLDEVAHVTEVDYLSSDFLLVDRHALDNPVFAQVRLLERCPDLEISASLKREGLSLVVIPHIGHYPINQPTWKREDIFRFTYLFLNRSFVPKKWHEINMVVLPSLVRGDHFARLKKLNQPALLVFGCQRSGTTWLNQLIGESIKNVVPLSENQTFDFLIDSLNLPDDFKDSVLSLQTTFIVSERESYLNVPQRTLRVFVLRNPLSVCWSLLYHFNALEMVWSSRSIRFSTNLLKQFDGNLPDLDKAICLYLDSLETAELLLHEAISETVFIDYDQLVLRPSETVVEIVNRMKILHPDMICVSNTFSDRPTVSPDLKPLRKHEQLSEFESAKVRLFCYEKYMTLRDRACNVHNN